MTSVARPSWRAVAIPTEHGGWGLTLEPVLLGLLVAPSIAGGAIAIAAFLAFLVRTPLKVVLVDRHRHRSLDRDRLARRIVVVELVVLVTMAYVALARAGVDWFLPLAAAAPLFVVELWFDARSRGRRLVPELCGAVGISAVAAGIAVAGGASWALAIALWLVLASRALASIPFARVQVLRLRKTPPSNTTSDLGQLAGLVVAVAAVVVDASVALGAAALVALDLVQFGWSRGPARPAKVVGFSQLGFGVAVVVATAIGARM